MRDYPTLHLDRNKSKETVPLLLLQPQLNL